MVAVDVGSDIGSAVDVSHFLSLGFRFYDCALMNRLVLLKLYGWLLYFARVLLTSPGFLIPRGQYNFLLAGVFGSQLSLHGL